ncbi:MAG: PilZ domain-containing protein [Pseudomonadota bacterium]
MYRDPACPSPMELSPGQAGLLPLAQRRTERRAVDLLVRYAWNGLRGTALIKDLTPFGARIERIDALRQGDWLTLLLPGMPAAHATVAWASGGAAGLAFDEPLDRFAYEAVVAEFAPAAAGDTARWAA